MPLNQYGVLKGRAVAAKREQDTQSPHYQVHIVASDEHYRIAVNVMSVKSPSELLFIVDDSFEHPITNGLPGLADGFNLLQSKPGKQALDFIRGNLFDRLEMRILPANVSGLDNDLSDQVEHFVDRAIQESDAVVYAFGQRWGPEGTTKDKVFNFLPGNGVHDIHMNQGNVPPFLGDDDVWQNGGLLFQFPSTDQCVPFFLAFQSQAWHTDDRMGHTIAEVITPDHVARIIAALVNPIGPAPEQETVTILNASPASIDLNDWQIADKMKNKASLSGTLEAGCTQLISLPRTVQLGNKFGLITILDKNALKLDGVSYTQEQAKKEGWTIVF